MSQRSGTFQDIETQVYGTITSNPHLSPLAVILTIRNHIPKSKLSTALSCSQHTASSSFITSWESIGVIICVAGYIDYDYGLPVLSTICLLVERHISRFRLETK